MFRLSKGIRQELNALIPLADTQCISGVSMQSHINVLFQCTGTFGNVHINHISLCWSYFSTHGRPWSDASICSFCPPQCTLFLIWDGPGQRMVVQDHIVLPC